VWEGRFKDSVFCVLRIEVGDKITGTLSAGNIKMNDEGDDTAVKFEMKLTGTGKAGLRVIFDGYRNFKPWLLTRK
jgi:hypothetical protein